MKHTVMPSRLYFYCLLFLLLFDDLSHHDYIMAILENVNSGWDVKTCVLKFGVLMTSQASVFTKHNLSLYLKYLL